MVQPSANVAKVKLHPQNSIHKDKAIPFTIGTRRLGLPMVGKRLGKPITTGLMLFLKEEQRFQSNLHMIMVENYTFLYEYRALSKEVHVI